MKMALLVFLITIASHAEGQIKDSPPNVDLLNLDKRDDTSKVIDLNIASFVTEEGNGQRPPSFPGGEIAFLKYLRNNIQYPIIAQKNKVEGMVVISFAIERDGSINFVKIDSSVSPEIDAEAKRVILNSPKWSPGYQNFKPVRVLYTITLNFSLKN